MVNCIHLGLIHSLNFKFKLIPVYSLYLHDCPLFLHRIMTNEHGYVKMWQMVMLLPSNENEKCKWNRSWFLKTTALLTWIDGNVSSASWMNAMWCKAKGRKLSDHLRSKKENNLFWINQAFVSFSFYFNFLDLHHLCWLIHCWHTPNRKGLQTNQTSE